MEVLEGDNRGSFASLLHQPDPDFAARQDKKKRMGD
jgi:hypothetical protein